MITENLQKAIDSLHIQDVYVRDLVARCVDDFEPKYAPDIESLHVQQMHLITRSDVASTDEGNNLLRVFLRLGARWVDPNEIIQSGDSDEEPAIRAVIEAEFVAEYEMSDTLEQDCIDEFCFKNASYHVWPYWRELLSNQCIRMHLPKLVLPAVQLAHSRNMNSEENSLE